MTVPFARLLLALAGLGAVLPGRARADPSQPERAPHANWFATHLEQRRELATGNHPVCLLGDSLFAFWPTHGKGSWELDLAPLRPFNAGIAGDRVEHLHFRVRHADFGRQPPRTFLLLIGTNNLGQAEPDDPATVSAGIFALVDTLKQKAPRARIVLISLLPSGREPGSPLRRGIRETNRWLAERAKGAGIEFLDVHDRFLQAEGNWKPGLTLDGTHLTSRGYDVLAAPIRELLAESESP